MAMLVMDPEIQKQLQAQRAARGADRYDEVWEGTYMMAPMPSDEHQRLVSRLVYIFEEIIGVPGRGEVRPGVNVSDRDQGEDWRENYRVPDVAVFLSGGRAQNRGAYWYGGPDFAVEIVSPEDRTLDKLPFYAKIGVRELLVIDPAAHAVELYALRDELLQMTGRSCMDTGESLASTVLPFRFRFTRDSERPRIEVRHTASDKIWLI